MVNELGYVATVRGWFENNYSVLNDNYSRSADLLGEAVGDVDFATSKTVTVKWLEMGLDIVSRIAAFIPGDGRQSYCLGRHDYRGNLQQPDSD